VNRVSAQAAAPVIPPSWSAAEVGSFAWDTVKRRMPEILAGTRQRLGDVPPDVDVALSELDDELRAGRLRGLHDQAADRVAWDAATAPHSGARWLELPWYFAESYFYRRILEATGYFGGGPLAGRDPFAAHKADEWLPEEGPRRTAELLQAAPVEPTARLRALLLGSLWGNRADLSYNVARALGTFMGEAHDLLVDDSDAVVRRLVERPAGLVTVIADNAGTECLMDLALIDHLLGSLGVPVVDLHVKDHPFFVSDSIAADIDAALAALAGSGRAETVALGQRLRQLRAVGRLIVRSHPFYTSSGFFPQLPDDLRAELGRSDLVLVKGDANYRRLCSDAHWPPETRFADVVGSFPAPLCALRTMKAEVVVGLPAGLAAELNARDPKWMVDGRRGLIQARL
jgi:hypothetical protein